MSYSFLTYAQTRTALAQRLFDSTKQLFSDAELKVYILESLQTFNALCNFYRAPMAFNTSANVTWYDLTAVGGTLRPFTTTDLSLINRMEYHLIEPQTTSYPLTWTGSNQFAVTDLLNALQQVRDQVLSETGCTISQSLVTANTGTTTLPDSAIDIRRVAWIPNTGAGFTPNLLHPSDFWSDQSFNKNFNTAASTTPFTYRRSTAPPISFQPDTTLPVGGNFDVLTINAGTTLSTTQSTIFPIPDDWTWIVKWGALAQLLGRMSMATDPLRYQYCLARYKAGVIAMQTAPALLAGQIGSPGPGGGQYVSITALTDADHYAANWQGVPISNPTAIYYAGLNLVALAPIPDGVYSVTVFVVRNMVLPSADGDFIQASRDDVQAILDYAQHMAMFKIGGEEFLETLPLYENFIRHCRLYNSKLAAQSLYREFMEGKAKADERLHPVFTEPNPTTVTNS